MDKSILNISLPGFPHFKSGKVRDLFDLGDTLLLVASDRISAFDSIMPEGIPDKGKILTQISLFWFEFTKNIIPNHVITGKVDEYPIELKKYKDILEKRSMLGKKAGVVPIECVVRGYLSGSGWKEYQKSGSICGIKLPTGLKESDKLPEPIFTPSTKADSGHDINISEKEMLKKVGEKIGKTLKEKSIALFNAACKHAEACGIIIADTKFEFGMLNNKIILVDEIFTPDSSRFWPKNEYKPGGPQPSFDKQYLRDWLESINWDKEPPAPHLIPEVIEKTREKYFEAFQKITGKNTL